MLKEKLEKIIVNIKKIPIASIKYDSNKYVKYEIYEGKEKNDADLISRGMRLRYTYRSIFEEIMKKLLDNSFKLKIGEFQELMREKLSTELFYILMNNNQTELKNALSGEFTQLTKGGKRKTKKIKNNRHISKKTRSIKKSKKNITRRI